MINHFKVTLKGGKLRDKMKFNYKKIASVMGGVFMVGATIAAGAAAGLPNSFIDNTNTNVQAVTGVSAHADDVTAALNIGNIVANKITDNLPVTGESDFTGVEGVEEDVTIGGSIVSGKILSILTDNKIPSLLDDKINWDDGDSSDNTFNFHEELLINDMNLLTSLNDNDFEGVALTNNKGLAYRLFFEEDMNTDLIGDEDADTLYLNILGEEYEVDAMDSNSITVVTSSEIVLNEGEVTTVDGVSFELAAVGEDSVSINGVVVKEGRTKRVDGMEIHVDSVFYKSDGVGSLAVLKIGKDITTEYSSGDEFIGQDDDDPEWVWEISDPGKNGGYIGVVYNHKNTRAKDDGVVYEGGAYEFPNTYAAVQFNGLTDVTYEDFEVSFIDDKDLWNSTGKDSVHQDVPVVTIEGPNEESIVVNGKETDTIYVRYATTTSGTEINGVNGAIEVFYEDVNKDASDSVRARYIAKYDLDATHSIAGDTTIATLISDDSNVEVKIHVLNGKLSLILDSGVSETSISIGGDTLTDIAGTFEHLGAVSEDAESGDVSVDGITIGTEDYDVMDPYGTIIQSPDGNSNDDRVVLSIPSEQVEAKISVIGQGSEVIDSEVILPKGTDYIVKDTSVDKLSTTNLIIVGGSCINQVARELLGETEPLCGTEFTERTGVSAGQYMIEVFKSPYNEEKVAVLVAGYNKEDTTRGVKELLDGTAGIDMTIIGQNVIK